jgi:zinc transport system substrate-binding protein
LNINQLQQLFNSELCFTIGHLPFEQTHLYPVLQHHPEIQVINHSKNIQLLHGSCGCSHTHHEGHGHGVDPHIWLSPKVVRNMATQIYESLCTKYPDQKLTFQDNYNRLATAIDTLQQKAAAIFKQNSQHSFLIYHPALTYFAADYGLEQIAIEDEGKEPSPTHLKKVIDIAKEKKIRLIFIQKQFDLQNAQTIAREINGKIIQIDPLAEDWLAEIQKIVKIFQSESANTNTSI